MGLLKNSIMCYHGFRHLTGFKVIVRMLTRVLTGFTGSYKDLRFGQVFSLGMIFFSIGGHPTSLGN